MGAETDEIERLYRERYGTFRNGLAPVVGSYDEARDVVQEAFARALRSRAAFRGDGTLQSWVWKIALRVASERRGRPTAAWDGSAAPQLVEPERDPELAEALRSLPARKRLVVFLRYFADLTYAEIAEAMEISEGTVAATLNQARGALEEQLSPEVKQR